MSWLPRESIPAALDPAPFRRATEVLDGGLVVVTLVIAFRLAGRCRSACILTRAARLSL